MCRAKRERARTMEKAHEKLEKLYAQRTELKAFREKTLRERDYDLPSIRSIDKRLEETMRDIACLEGFLAGRIQLGKTRELRKRSDKLAEHIEELRLDLAGLDTQMARTKRLGEILYPNLGQRPPQLRKSA